MPAEPEPKPTFVFHNRLDNSQQILPITTEALKDPQFTLDILNARINNNPDTVRFPHVVRTNAYHYLLRYAIPPDDREFRPTISVAQLNLMSDEELKKARLSKREIAVFRTAFRRIR